MKLERNGSKGNEGKVILFIFVQMSLMLSETSGAVNP